MNETLKKIRGKRAETELWAPDTMPFWIIFAVVLGFTAIYFAIIITSIGSRQIEIPKGLEEHILAKRFIYSDNCFLFKDKEGGIKPDVIDYSKFSQERMNNCFSVQEGKYAYKLKLRIGNSEPELKSSNWDNELKAMAKSENRVLVLKDKKVEEGVFVIETQNLE